MLIRTHNALFIRPIISVWMATEPLKPSGLFWCSFCQCSNHMLWHIGSNNLQYGEIFRSIKSNGAAIMHGFWRYTNVYHFALHNERYCNAQFCYWRNLRRYCNSAHYKCANMRIIDIFRIYIFNANTDDYSCKTRRYSILHHRFICRDISCFMEANPFTQCAAVRIVFLLTNTPVQNGE